MKQTDQSLLEQMRITDLAISSRKELFSFTATDENILKKAKPYIEKSLGPLAEQFYEAQTAVPDVVLLIGDSDTLRRLKSTLCSYILDLFSGYYDMEYVNNRLRIGLVHKRIGVEPKLYLAAVQTLSQLLLNLVENTISDATLRTSTISALQKLLMFDVSLVFDTYVRGMISEIEISREKSEAYAHALEAKVRERTMQLETLSRTDPLTGLLNVRHLESTLTQVLRAAQRRREVVTAAYVDVNDFKVINDTLGHQRGDEILQMVADALRSGSRLEDHCFRYGGDEFCVVMANCTLANANLWKERILQILQRHENSPALSIGFAQTGPDDYVSPEKLIRLADEEMYKMKKGMKEAE
jgi:diguanylate cyclase